MILPELAKMTQFAKQPGNKQSSDQRTLVEAPIEWIAREFDLFLFDQSLVIQGNDSTRQL
jgi:hypothetical protein